MNQQTTETQWYIARDGKQHGPLTETEMRTFVAHSYLRTSDLIWRPGLPEWQSAPEVFPQAFNPQPAAQPQPTAAAQQASSQFAPIAKPQTTMTFPSAPKVDPQAPEANDGQSSSPRRRLAIAAAVAAIIGGGAFALANFREPIGALIGGGGEQAGVVAAPQSTGEAPSSPAESAPATPAPESVQTAEAQPPAATPPTATDAAQPPPRSDTQTAALAPANEPARPPPSIDGSPIDERLRKIPAWALIKSDYPQWYVDHIAAAEKLAAEQKPESEIALHLAQGLVTLRRQNADKALHASSEKLRNIASAFLDNLKALRTVSVSACYGFISKGETSPAVVQLMQTPDAPAATALNMHVAAVFEAISEGSKTPVDHEPAAKADYDVLIKELGKLGWKEEDLQAFSNPRLLAKREPEKVCQMVQDWFVAHLAVPDKTARDRLLFETLKPVVSG